MRSMPWLHAAILSAAVTPSFGSVKTSAVRSTSIPVSPACIDCIDVRTGASFQTAVLTVGESGAIDSTSSSASRLCVGALAAVHSVVCSDGAGGALVAWVEPAGEDNDLRLQRVDAQGSIVEGWPQGGRIVCDSRGSQSQPALTRDGSGGIWLAWSDHRGSPRASVRVMRLESDGTPSGNWPGGGRAATASTAGQAVPRLAPSADGRLWLLWQEGRAGVP